jgi:pilus assembly protein CpaE
MAEDFLPDGSHSEIIVNNAMTNIVAVMRSEESASLLKEAAEGLEETNLEVIVSPIENLEKNPAAMNGHDILLIDVAPSNAAETDQLKRFIDHHHQTRPVIVTSAVVDREGVSRIMRSGAADILPQPIRPVDLVIAIDQAIGRHTYTETPDEQRGKVISILKGGGGVGATTLAVQAAGLMALDKQSPSKVCVLDFDIQFGAVSLYLDMNKNLSLTDLIQAPDRLDQEFLSGVMLNHESGLDVLRAPNELIPLDSISPDFVLTLLDLVRGAYDFVFIDLPQSWTEWTYTTLCNSDLMLLVTQLNVGCIRHTATQIETINKHDLGDRPLKLVLNRYAFGMLDLGDTSLLKRLISRHAADMTSEDSSDVRDAEKALGRPFDFLLPNAYDLTKTAINRGMLIPEFKRRSNFEKRLQSICNALRETMPAEKERQLSSHKSNQ